MYGVEITVDKTALYTSVLLRDHLKCSHHTKKVTII